MCPQLLVRHKAVFMFYLIGCSEPLRSGVHCYLLSMDRPVDELRSEAREVQQFAQTDSSGAAAGLNPGLPTDAFNLHPKISHQPLKL